MSFNHLEDEETPQFRARNLSCQTVLVSRQMVGSTIQFFDEINESKSKLGTIRSMQAEPIFDQTFAPSKPKGNSTNFYDQSSLTITQIKMLTDLDAVQEFLEQVKLMLTK